MYRYYFKMNKYKVIIILTISIFMSTATLSISDGWKNPNTRVDTAIPISMAGDLLSILINGTVHLAGTCTTDVDTSQVQYWLYTRANNSTGELIVGTGNIDPAKRVIILLHGWGGFRNVSYIIPIRTNYTLRYDANVIVVDYGPYANSDYQSGYCNAPYVAKNVAKFICLLKSALGISIPLIHVVGHSLGAQIAGMAGSGTQATCGATIGRITGLDPAGPLYEGISPINRLDKTDASYVDVMHTNQGLYGYIGQLGHVDFYPNSGVLQPGCPSVLTNLTFLSNLTADSVTSYPLSFVTCNHQRSCYLFAESININSFYSSSVFQCVAGLCVPTIPTTNCYMGENLRAPPPGTNNQFTCTTNAVSKFGQGPDGPLTEP